MSLGIPKYFTLKSTKLVGIYFLINNKRVTYIGQTKNLFGRLYGHSRTFDSIRFIGCDASKLTYYEKRWILKFKPKHNIMHNQTSKHVPKKEVVISLSLLGWTKLKRQAGRNNRSLTAEIVTILTAQKGLLIFLGSIKL